MLLVISISCIGVLYAMFRENPIYGTRFVPRGGLPDGYTWELWEGPDFDIYDAKAPNSEDSGAGIYLGYHPNFPYTDDLLRKDGFMLGTRVSWIVLDGSEETVHSFYRTTLLNYQHSLYAPTYVHTWVYAEEEEELETLLDSLENLRIRPMMNVFQYFAWRLSWYRKTFVQGEK